MTFWQYKLDTKMADDSVHENREDELIKYYFFKGYEYTDILRFLADFHNIMSKSTLQRRLKSYGIG